MDLEELKERYKMLPLYARFLICAVLGLLPGAYVYYDEGDALQAQLDEQITQEQSARAKFEESRQRKANLPKLEEDLAFTEEQLIKAKKKLPDSYKIEEILQKAATIAKEVGVKLVQFDPGEEVPHVDTYRYVELPIKTELEGRFSQVAAFFDRVVHLESSIFVKNIELSRHKAPAKEGFGGPESQKSDFQLAREARQNVRLKSVFEMVIFRGMTDSEAAQAPAGGEEAEPKAKKKRARDEEGGEAQPKAEPDTASLPKSNDVTTF